MLVDPRSPIRAPAPARAGSLAGAKSSATSSFGRATFTDAKARVHIRGLAERPYQPALLLLQRGQRLPGNLRQREVEGDIVQRRTVTIEDGALLRVASPQGVLGQTWGRTGAWRRSDVPVRELAGGERTAMRPAPRRGRARCRSGRGAAPGSAPARDRGAHRSTPVRDS